MAHCRPVVSVYQHDAVNVKTTTLPLPTVMCSGLRPDLVTDIVKNVDKNARQAYAVKKEAGYNFAAASWGTGRAVARIPRVPGGGTHRSGQGAFGNMCRGGGMFSPTKVYRRWHRRVNKTMKRHAVVTSLAASTLPPLVMARGHRINEVQELPLVVSDGAQNVQKTKQAVQVLKNLGCEEELSRSKDSRQVRAGPGKVRGRKYQMRLGPLVIYAEDNGIVKAMRNIPGVTTRSVDKLNILELAPGGHFGRFCVWTESAFKKLNAIYGHGRATTPGKKGYNLPRQQMENTDLARIINSDEVQSVLRPKLEGPKRLGQKKNPLTNKMAMARLNPGSLQVRTLRHRAHVEGTEQYKEVKKRVKARREESNKHHKGSRIYYQTLMKAFEGTKATEAEAEAEE